jgi:Amino acid permease/Sigma-70 region 2
MMDTLTSAVEELYILYHKDIVRFFAEHLSDRDTSWDLCHEVYVRLLIALASGIQLQHPQRWLMRVAKNLLIDTYRHRQATAEVKLPFDYPMAGGGYAFAQALLGPHWGFLMGWGYWGAYIFISGYVTLGFGGYLHALTGLPPIAGALALIGISTAINLVGVRLSGLVQSPSLL